MEKSSTSSLDDMASTASSPRSAKSLGLSPQDDDYSIGEFDITEHVLHNDTSMCREGAMTPGRSFPTPDKPFKADFYRVENLTRYKIKTALRDMGNISRSDLTSFNQAKELLSCPVFTNQLRPKDVLYISNNMEAEKGDIDNLWKKFSLEDFYMNYNDDCSDFILQKFNEKPSLWAYIMLSLSHVLFLISLFLRNILDILENFTSNYDLDFSPKVSVVMFSFVPKVPMQYTMGLVATALLWPIVGIMFSSQILEFAKILFNHNIAKFKFSFSVGMETMSTTMHNYPKKLFFDGGNNTSWVPWAWLYKSSESNDAQSNNGHTKSD